MFEKVTIFRTTSIFLSPSWFFFSLRIRLPHSQMRKKGHKELVKKKKRKIKIKEGTNGNWFVSV